MIQVETKLKTIDNSGARYVQCIKALGGYNRTYAYCGDFIITSWTMLTGSQSIPYTYSSSSVKSKPHKTFLSL